jgi:hypothetical protein
VYTLANDTVLHQLVALLHSLQANAGAWPVCVIPYDDRVDGVTRELARHPGVTLWEDAEVLGRWDDFAARAWHTHPTAPALWRARREPGGLHRFGVHRRFAAFDGPFERFVYLDADVLVFASLAPFFDELSTHAFVTYDDQFRAPRHVFDIRSPRLEPLFGAARLDAQIFCSGVFAARRGLFDDSRREWLLERLADGEAEVLYPWAPCNALLNYMVLRSGIHNHNRYRDGPPAGGIATCVTAPHLQRRSGHLFDGDRPLPFLHYIGVPPSAFNRLCDGRNVAFPYRDLFLHYRYLDAPERTPRLTGRPRAYNARPPIWRRLLRRVRRASARLR